MRIAKRWWSRRKKIVLASASPRRQELLALTGLKFEVVVPQISEKLRPEETPREHVERLAMEKAQGVAKDYPDDIVLGCDTVVILNGRKILGKPRDKRDAKAMLRRLAGKEHTVLSAIAAVWINKDKKRVVTIETRVRMKQLEEWEIGWYLDSGEYKDKAGAYAIQGRGAIFVEGIVGSYTNVMGLPLMETVLLLRSYGIRL
ncbi:MAG: septum formation inhibitor Maf [Deltaproteobacteria bacterium]|nr:septum formation inhibitor Maf [Deltaproteobacteria bacterium]